MVHKFLEAISLLPNLADEYASRTPQRLKFSKLFAIFFPEGGHLKYGANMSSWLEVISRTFNYDEGSINPFIVGEVEDLFKVLNIPNHPRHVENINIFHFWLYLHFVYWRLVKSGYNRDDKVFNFMTAFRIEDTKVVIVANDPAETVESSGFAFHESPTESTDQIMDFVCEELAWVSQNLGNSSFKITVEEIEEAKTCANLKGWINQGVLLLNSSLTYSNGQSEMIHVVWQEFTDFILDYLSQTKEHLPFLLLGNEAWPISTFIDNRKHMVLQLYHPSYYRIHDFELSILNTSKDWAAMLPFLNINLYLFQKNGLQGMIDFNSITDNKDGKDGRLRRLARFFQEIISKISNIESFVSLPITADVCIKKIVESNASNLAFRNNKRIKEMEMAVDGFY